MTREEYEKHILINSDGKFYPRYTLEKIQNEDGEVDYFYTIIVSAEQVYQEFLNPTEPPTDKMEVLTNKISILENENEELKARVDMAENALLDIMINQMRV